MQTRFRFALALSLLLGLAACQSTYYAVWEKLGREKRDLLRSGVENARVEQKEAREQFRSTLDRIKEVYGLDGGEIDLLV